MRQFIIAQSAAELTSHARPGLIRRVLPTSVDNATHLIIEQHFTDHVTTSKTLLRVGADGRLAASVGEIETALSRQRLQQCREP